jgi:signal transduction histidine kinase
LPSGTHPANLPEPHPPDERPSYSRHVPQGTDEQSRLEALSRYGLLDAVPNPDLQSVVDLAAFLCGVPTAVVNIIDAEHQRQLAATGFEPGVMNRCDSMCTVTIEEDAPVLVPDATLDPRFNSNPFVTGALDNIRFYAASQLREPSGAVLGTLCVYDTTVRTLTAEQRDGLDKLARMVMDVLELRRHAELLREALQEVRATSNELLRSNAALSDFAGQVSHDLKNPLTGVLGFVATVADLPAVAGDPVARRGLERALSSATRMWRMIEDVLSHASAGSRHDLQRVPMNEVARWVVDDLEPTIRAAGATVRTADLPVVVGDPTQLRVLLQNLVSNAVKFRRTDVPCQVYISAEEDVHGWTLSVADNGIGIPVADRERVLELFTRLRPDIEGSGIGLATVRRIVAAHQASLEIDDTPGGGTTIYVNLPRRRATLAPELLAATA